MFLQKKTLREVGGSPRPQGSERVRVKYTGSNFVESSGMEADWRLATYNDGQTLGLTNTSPLIADGE